MFIADGDKKKIGDIVIIREKNKYHIRYEKKFKTITKAAFNKLMNKEDLESELKALFTTKTRKRTKPKNKKDELAETIDKILDIVMEYLNKKEIYVDDIQNLNIGKYYITLEATKGGIFISIESAIDKLVKPGK